MIRGDGIMIARYPERPEFLGKSFSNQPVFKQLVDVGKLGEAVIVNGKRLTSGEDELRIVAPSQVEGFPVIVNVTIGAALALARWRETVLLVFGLTMPLLLVVLFMTHRTAILLYAQHRALTRVSEEKERADKAGGELVRMSRLSTMQEMSSAIAHELNQPLSATANYLSVATMQLGTAGGLDSMRQAEVLDKAQDQVHRAGEIIRRLRNFISRGKSEEEEVSIDAIVDAAISFSLIRDQYPGLRLSVLLPSRPVLYVRVDALQIQQVLMNLIRNAAEAMSEQSDRQLTIAAKPFTPSLVEVCVRDNGPGMPEQVRSRIFQPFNSGKADGMGVGLSICRTIVEAHGGSISVESVAAGGTEFRFTLPAVTV
jgi:C4-dicarboxylate-specific signal transduction histidine kinase